VPAELLDPRDLTAKLRPTAAASARPAKLLNGKSVRLRKTDIATSHASGLDRREWSAIHGIVRAILVAEETCRLYPAGHGRPRQALKQVLQRLQEYSIESGREFCFVPDVALDVTATDKSRAAKDLAAFAYMGRVQLIRSLTIEREVDLDELEEFIRFLQTNPDSPVADAGQGAIRARALAWRAIRIEFYEGEDDGEGYAFNDGGEQLFPAAAGGGDGASEFPAQVPHSLQKTLAGIFSDPGVQSNLESLEKRFGVEGLSGIEELPASDTRPGSNRVDLVHEIVRHLFEDGRSYVDTPRDVLKSRVDEFIAFLDGVARRLPDSGGSDAVSLNDSDVSELLQKAAGLHSWNQPGIAELFRQSARLKDLFDAPETLGARGLRREATRGAPPPPPASPPPVGKPDRPRPDTDLSRGTESAEETGGVTLAGLPDFADLLAVDADAAGIEADLTRDWHLESMRVQLELMADETDAERYRGKRARFLDFLAQHEWDEPDALLDELDAAVLVLSYQGLECAMALLEDALCHQSSQDVVNRFFEARVHNGAEIETLRPILGTIAEREPNRSIEALTYLWKTGGKTARRAYVDEIFALPLESYDLAGWASRHPQAFASTHSLAHLSDLSPRTLEEVLVKVLTGGPASKLGAPPAAVAILRAVGSTASGEHMLAVAMKLGNRRLRMEALSVLERPRSKEMISALKRLIEHQNSIADPDLDEIRLVLTALLRSGKPMAREAIHTIRTERRRLRHVYRKEIREILDLLRKMEGFDA